MSVWTDVQDAILVKVWHDLEIPSEKVEQLVGRTMRACGRRAATLGIGPRTEREPVSGAAFKPRALLSEKQIAAIYAGRRYG